jgi:acetylornithine deacetylase/succinyl-diaminopimelate desuccinylase-like protein
MPQHSSQPPAGLRDARAAAAEVARLLALKSVKKLLAWIGGHEAEITAFQMTVTAIPAPTGAEARRAAFLAERFKALGWQVEADAVGNQLLCPQPPRPGEPLIAMSAHMDTVFGPGVPIELHEEYATIHGPGISDNGAGLAALWAVAAALSATGLQTELPLLLVANVCEEGEGNLRGIRHLFESSPYGESISSLLAVDGSGSESIIAQALGSRRFEVVFHGPGGHSWIDFGAPNPVMAMARAIDLLGRIELPATPKTALTVSVVAAGTSINAIPETAAMKIDTRSEDEAQLDRLEELLQAAVDEAMRTAGEGLHCTIQPLGSRPAGNLRREAPILLATEAASRHLGLATHLERASTDANIPISLGIDALAIGTGGNGGGAHTIHEWYSPEGRTEGLQRILLILLALAGVRE